MFGVNNLQVFSERMQDMERAAVQRQPLRRAWATQGVPARQPSRLAVWLGGQFVHVGLRLLGQQASIERYAD